MSLASWSFLLFLVESQQRHIGYFDNLETDAGNITDGVALSTETSHQNLVVFHNIVETTVSGNECGDLFAVLDQLDTDALSDSRVRLLSFDTDFFKNDALGM